MKIFVYEHICATFAPGDGNDSLEREGRAMLAAVSADLAASSDTEVMVCLHPEQQPLGAQHVVARGTGPDVQQTIANAAKWADVSIVIAPESQGVLLQVCRWIIQAGGSLFGPGIDVIHVYSDKLQTHHRLGRASIATYPVTGLPSHHDRIVVKPRDGAGTTSTVICSSGDLPAAIACLRQSERDAEFVAQPFIDGLPASIALFGRGSDKPILLPAVEQVMLSASIADVPARSLQYDGGRMPIASELENRARRLAECVIEATPNLTGYLGIDVILGAASDGSMDYIVEVNPRLTTSYVGYSRIFGRNLDWGRLLRNEDDALKCRAASPGTLRFYPDGRCRWESESLE